MEVKYSSNVRVLAQVRVFLTQEYLYIRFSANNILKGFELYPEKTSRSEAPTAFLNKL